MANADHIEPHGPEPLDEEVRRRIGRGGTEHLLSPADERLDELHQGGGLSRPRRAVERRDLRGTQGVGHGPVLRDVQVGMLERIGLDRFGTGVTEDNLPSAVRLGFRRLH